MRRCNICKREEGALHMEQCQYYWALVGANKMPRADGETCFIEDTEGCPDRRDGAAELNCPGCVECDIDA